MLRAALIVVIVAGLAVVGLNLTKVTEKIKTLNSELEQSRVAEKQATDNASKSRAAEKKAKDEADKLKVELSTATNQLEVTMRQFMEQKSRADRVAQELDVSNRDRNEAQQQLAQWQALGTPVEQIKARLVLLTRVTEERDRFTDENKVLLRRVASISDRLKRYEGPVTEVKLPALKAKVLAVDPKYDFVVVDIGSNQGVKERGKLIVTREGKLLAKLQITSVEQNRSVANVLPEWKQGEVMEGDQVLTSYEALAQP